MSSHAIIQNDTEQPETSGGRGFLSGEEPNPDQEEKTEAQLKDEYRPGFSASEVVGMDDEAPAISQVVKHIAPKPAGETTDEDVMVAEKHNAKPTFDIDQKFVEEINERNQKEQAAREKRHAAERAVAEKAEKERQKELEKKLAETQTLDPEAEHDQLENEHYFENRQNLYPDKIKSHTDVEDAQWRQHLDEDKKLPERARLVDIYNKTLHNYIVWSFICQGMAAVLLPFILIGFLPPLLNELFTYGIIAIFIISIVLLHLGGRSCSHRTVPSTQQNAYILASEVSTLALRTVLAMFSMYLIGRSSIIGMVAGVFIGVLIGSAIQYDLFTRYHVVFRELYTIINLILFAVYMAFQLFAIDSSMYGTLTLIAYVVCVLCFFTADRLAFRMSKLPE